MVNKAREYLGVPYHHGGRSRNSVDCAGLVLCVFKDLGNELNPVPHYGRLINPRFIRDRVSENFQAISGGVDDALPGDILIIRFNGIPQHLAIFTGSGLIHSYEKAGKVVEHRLADVWKQKITGVYRYVN